MSKQSTGSSPPVAAVGNGNLTVSMDDLRNLGWEVVDDRDDLYADVDSLDSFSLSSQTGGEEEDVERSPRGRIDLHVIADFLGFNAPRADVGVSCGLEHYRLSEYDGRDELDDVGYLSNLGFLVGDDDILGFHAPGPIVARNPPPSPSCRSLTLLAPAPNDDDVRRALYQENRSCGFVINDVGKGNRVGGDDDHGRDYDYDDDEDDVCTGEVDDELVPWGLANRLAKQRMRKLGKRTFAKMKKSKKMGYTYTQAACVHGKHGLGLKVY